MGSLDDAVRYSDVYTGLVAVFLFMFAVGTALFGSSKNVFGFIEFIVKPLGFNLNGQIFLVPRVVFVLGLGLFSSVFFRIARLSISKGSGFSQYVDLGKSEGERYLERHGIESPES